MLDRQVHGRLFFEQVIRENLDLGRPQEVGLIAGHQGNSAPTSSPGRHPILKHLLQEHADQAASQGKPGLADRDDYQQQLRLRRRQTSVQPAEAARDCLCGQSSALTGLRAVDAPLKRAFDNINTQVNAWIDQAQFAA